MEYDLKFHKVLIDSKSQLLVLTVTLRRYVRVLNKSAQTTITMLRFWITLIAVFPFIFHMKGKAPIVVADSATHAPLANASIFDRSGAITYMSDHRGRLPDITENQFPITVRYLGFKEKTARNSSIDTIFLQGIATELPEVIVETRQQKVLHMLAYTREYSTLTTYSDTVFLFREKMTDFMLPFGKKLKFSGWTNPRVLKTKSYYRFTNADGLDSVSNTSRHHFSWSDWIGVAPSIHIPVSLKPDRFGSDTLWGKYSPKEIWTKNSDRIAVDINVLADSTSRKWVPNIAVFFHGNLDFEDFKIRFNYDNVDADSVFPSDLTGYSYNIASRGRGFDMFRFNRINEPFFVNTYAEVYILDKEYITVKEARKWARQNFTSDLIEIYEPAEAPELQPSIQQLICRVENIDHDQVRLAIEPDRRLMSRNGVNKNFRIGNRILNVLKELVGISSYKANRNFKRNWNDMKHRQIENNKRGMP